METLKHPACTVGWVVRLSCSWLSLGEGTPNFLWEKSHLDNTDTVCKKEKKRKKEKELKTGEEFDANDC